MNFNPGRGVVGCAALALATLLGGCDARITVDFGSDPPADPAITTVNANLLGLQFRKSDGSTATLEFRDPELVDLLDLRDGDPMRLFTNEGLPSGTYTGVRLLFDADQDPNVVIGADEQEFPLLLAEGAYAVVDFKVEDGKDSSETLTLMLDLRQSLKFDDVDEDYTLTPRLRSARTGDAARIEGQVTVACPTDTSLTEGGALYLYSGTGIEPDDLDGNGAEPAATTDVVDTGATGFQYALRFLPAGDYTLALTCQGDEDLLGEDDVLEFQNVGDVQLDDGDVLQRNLD